MKILRAFVKDISLLPPLEQIKKQLDDGSIAICEVEAVGKMYFLTSQSKYWVEFSREISSR